MEARGIAGAVLAGGLSRRMGGGDKALRPLGGRPILDRVLDRFAAQCDQVILNANGDPARFQRHGLPVVADTVGGFAGPLAGIHAALEWVSLNRPGIELVATVPADCPFLPRDLVDRLVAARAREGAEIALAASGGRAHPVCGLFPVRLAGALRQALEVDGLRKVERWTGAHRVAVATWETAPVDPFFNVNTAEDIGEAEALLSRLGK
jgi:molybdopterin-guanine dinucleotide biosynthesis protein A